MNRSFFLAVALFIAESSVQAQFTVPDAAFATKLNQIVPAAMSGNVLDTSHPSVLALTYMNVNGAGIYDLDGIQYFTGLQSTGYAASTTSPPCPRSRMRSSSCSARGTTW